MMISFSRYNKFSSCCDNDSRACLQESTYKKARQVMFALPAEKAHNLVSAGLYLTGKISPIRNRLQQRLAPTDPLLANFLCGVHFPGPLGLAAGFDKDGRGLSMWPALGFGYAEIGTVTPLAQLGNPQPRLFRLPDDKALLNRMGFNNGGAQALIHRLEKYHGNIPLGVNIGKNKATPPDRVIQDYQICAQLVSPYAHYLVVNVSSPNTAGLRDLQQVNQLRPILRGVQQETDKPVFVKISPDLSDDEIDAIADLAGELRLAGIVATNTTISRVGLQSPNIDLLGSGGISGEPLGNRSREVLRRLYGRVGHQLVLISVGGISNAQDAFDRITAGASLLQAYTGWIYGGPFWVQKIHTQLALLLRQAGYSSIAQAIGAHAR